MNRAITVSHHVQVKMSASKISILRFKLQEDYIVFDFNSSVTQNIYTCSNIIHTLSYTLATLINCVITI